MKQDYRIINPPTKGVDNRGTCPVYELGFCCRTGEVIGHLVLRAVCEELLPNLQMGDRITFESSPE